MPRPGRPEHQLTTGREAGERAVATHDRHHTERRPGQEDGEVGAGTVAVEVGDAADEVRPGAGRQERGDGVLEG